MRQSPNRAPGVGSAAGLAGRILAAVPVPGTAAAIVGFAAPFQAIPLAHDVFVRAQPLRHQKGVQYHQLYIQGEQGQVQRGDRDQKPEEDAPRRAAEDRRVPQPPVEGFAIAEVRVQQERAGAEHGQNHHRNRTNRDEERAVVGPAHAVVYPHAVVVEGVHALVAHPAMLTARVHRHIADPAEGQAVILLHVHRGLVLRQDVRVHGVARGRLRCGQDENCDARQVQRRQQQFDIVVDQREHAG
mmetsp:Transcript_21612/g.64373  ORF Transcript_21612/g.64373 Transcript_21612/m.64373 type:complete len:243 (-) Transcript_21612:73-801(-)